MGIIEVLYTGGDEFVLCLEMDDAKVEWAISNQLARSSPLPVMVVFASKFSQALQDLAATKASHGMARGGPSATRNPRTHHIQIEVEYFDLKYLPGY